MQWIKYNFLFGLVLMTVSSTSMSGLVYNGIDRQVTLLKPDMSEYIVTYYAKTLNGLVKAEKTYAGRFETNVMCVYYTALRNVDGSFGMYIPRKKLASYIFEQVDLLYSYRYSEGSSDSDDESSDATVDQKDDESNE